MPLRLISISISVQMIVAVQDLLGCRMSLLQRFATSFWAYRSPARNLKGFAQEAKNMGAEIQHYDGI